MMSFLTIFIISLAIAIFVYKLNCGFDVDYLPEDRRITKKEIKEHLEKTKESSIDHSPVIMRKIAKEMNDVFDFRSEKIEEFLYKVLISTVDKKLFNDCVSIIDGEPVISKTVKHEIVDDIMRVFFTGEIGGNYVDMHMFMKGWKDILKIDQNKNYGDYQIIVDFILFWTPEEVEQSEAAPT